MALLLNIDTATEQASVCLSDGAVVLAEAYNTDQKSHASFLQPAIQQLVTESGHSLSTIEAVAVTAGPGSYTGLRVGLSSAKGLCYALNKPLIMINTLELMAYAACEAYTATGQEVDEKVLFCPMIDARRMEVFTALYNHRLEPLIAPAAVILNPDSFKEFTDHQIVVFSGSGSSKFKPLISGTAVFSEVICHAGHLAVLAAEAFKHAAFTNLAYSEPFYLKEFFSLVPKA